MGEISDGIGRDGEINHLDELPKVVAGSDGTELRMISVGYRCLGEIYIRYIRYPPTPADARGSAPGNNTFDSCFGLPQPQQQQQQQQQRTTAPAAAAAAASVLHCYGVSLSGTHVFAAASRQPVLYIVYI